MPIVGLVCGVGRVTSCSTTGTKGSTMSKLRKRFFWEALYALVLVMLCGCMGAVESRDGVPIGQAVDALEARSQRARIAAGAFHTLAITTEGEVWAWGKNNRGQLGNGTIVSSSTPVKFQPQSPLLDERVIAVATGHSHSIALTSGGAVLAWGDNEYSQLGSPGFPGAFNAAPQSVPLLGGVTAVAASTHHSLALTADGKVWAWGLNVNGQLGDCTTIIRAQPVTVKTAPNAELNNVIAIAAGSAHSMALTADGNVYTWGGNGFGQLGDGTLNGRACAAVVPSWSPTNGKAVDVVAGHVHSMTLMSNGDIYSWGQNTYGQLGHGNFTQSSVPAKVTTVADAKAIGAGYFHSFAILANGNAVAWGYNYYQQLGDGTSGSSPYAVGVSGVTGVMAVTGGLRHSVAIAANTMGSSTAHRGIWAWGANTDGQGGYGQASGQAEPTPVPVSDKNLFGVTQAVAGLGHTVAISWNGRIYTWGWNAYGQLGQGDDDDDPHPTPVLVHVEGQGGPSDTYPFVAVAVGELHSLALRSDGTVWAWGGNSHGQLGDASTTQRNSPVQVRRSTNPNAVLKGIVAIAAGSNHSLALSEEGIIYAWGHNIHGQLAQGNSSFVDSEYAVRIVTQSGSTPQYRVVSIAAGANHSIAVTDDGHALVWGSGNHGSHCDGTPVQQTRGTPFEINVQNVVSVRGGQYHTLLMRSNGEVMACGRNDWGQLGDDTYVDRVSPVAIGNFPPVVEISASGDSSMALALNGSLYGWGLNANGQLGIEPWEYDSSRPKAVADLSNVVSISTGGSHSVAVDAQGNVHAWGYNNKGQLGDNSTTDRSTPGPVSPVWNQP